MSNPERRAKYEAELALPPMPEELRYLWRVFNRLSARRGSNGFSVNPITHLEIDAFIRVTGMALAAWEVEVIEDLDDMYRVAIAGKTPND